MSWDDGNRERAVAICASEKAGSWFNEAINCNRGSRCTDAYDIYGNSTAVWYQDPVGDKDLRPANGNEVLIYRHYCPPEGQGDGDIFIKDIVINNIFYAVYIETQKNDFISRVVGYVKKLFKR